MCELERKFQEAIGPKYTELKEAQRNSPHLAPHALVQAAAKDNNDAAVQQLNAYTKLIGPVWTC